MRVAPVAIEGTIGIDVTTLPNVSRILGLFSDYPIGTPEVVAVDVDGDVRIMLSRPRLYRPWSK